MSGILEACLEAKRQHRADRIADIRARVATYGMGGSVADQGNGVEAQERTEAFVNTWGFVALGLFVLAGLAIVRESYRQNCERAAERKRERELAERVRRIMAASEGRNR